MVLGALQVDRVANLGVIIVVGLVVVAIVATLLARALAAKIVAAAVLVGLCMIVWAQRASLQDCATKVKADVTGGSPQQCSFLGIKVDVSPP